MPSSDIEPGVSNLSVINVSLYQLSYDAALQNTDAHNSAVKSRRNLDPDTLITI